MANDVTDFGDGWHEQQPGGVGIFSLLAAANQFGNMDFADGWIKVCFSFSNFLFIWAGVWWWWGCPFFKFYGIRCFISLFISSIHSPNYHFCALDTTLEVLKHDKNYIYSGSRRYLIHARSRIRSTDRQNELFNCMRRISALTIQATTAGWGCPLK